MKKKLKIALIFLFSFFLLTFFYWYFFVFQKSPKIIEAYTVPEKPAVGEITSFYVKAEDKEGINKVIFKIGEKEIPFFLNGEKQIFLKVSDNFPENNQWSVKVFNSQNKIKTKIIK